jgi:hypothetical protein
MAQFARMVATAMSPAVFTFVLTRGPSTTWLSLALLGAIGIAISVLAGRTLVETRYRSGHAHGADG